MKIFLASWNDSGHNSQYWVTVTAKEVLPSSYQCGCGHEEHFLESTITEMKQMSMRKSVRLCGEQGHEIVFRRGKAVEIICPKAGRCRVKR